MSSLSEAPVNKDQEKCLEQRKHICIICQKGFTKKTSLRSHLLIHSKEKPYECPTCQKCFTQRGTLKGHLKIHSGIKPYECPKCQKRFSHKGHMNIHLLSHSGEKLHECPSCQKQFSRKEVMMTHLKSHSGEKEHECPRCQKRFTQKGYFNMHLKIQPFVCLTCSKQFCQKRRLDRHLLDTHQKQSSTAKENVAVVKKEINFDSQPNESNFCFQVPIIKQEPKSEVDVADEPIPTFSYEDRCVKQEPIENADHI